MNHANTLGDEIVFVKQNSVFLSTVFYFMFLILYALSCPCFTHNLSQVYDMMLHDERYYPSFKQSPLYVRMLAELDMLKEPSYRGSDDGEGESFNGSPTGSINLVSLLYFLIRARNNLDMETCPPLFDE